MQVVQGAEYRREAEEQYVHKAPDRELRGDIFFSSRTGELVAGAVVQMGWRIAINPKDMEDADSVFRALSEVVTLDNERFFTSAARKSDTYEEVAFRLSDEEAAAVRALALPAVQTVRDSWRTYPGEMLAAHTLGFVGFRGETRTGVYGLERYWNDVLSREGSDLFVNPFAELFANVESLVSSDMQVHQGDVVTSIEPSAQRELEDVLSDIMETYSPHQAGGIVMDPATGEVLALAVRPAFDPNTYGTVADPAVFSNPAVESVYEMGSIMKPLTIAAALDAGVITPNTTYEDKGFIMKSGKRISNFDGKGRGVVSMQEVLNQSLNTGVSFAVDTMGHERFAAYMKAYGLGEETGIDLPGEIAGNIRSLENGSDIDYASASFGQSIAVTPIAMTRALGSLANGGVLPEPHVVRGVRYPSGITRSVTVPPPRRVLSEEAAATITDMLVKVYDDALLGGVLKDEHYSIAAKTGTAQIAAPGGGGYLEGRFLHSFFGYLPAHEPRFIVLLFAVEPQREIYASHTLARPFSQLAKFLVSYYEVPPDRGSATLNLE